jgi:hypothetical protein
MPDPKDIHFMLTFGQRLAQVIEFISHLQNKCAHYYQPFQSRNVALSLAQAG